MKNSRKFVVVMVLVAVFVAFSAPVWAADVEKININTANAEELMKLERIGPKYAARIIEFREKNGPFKAPEDIMKVKGIGQKTWEENKDQIVVE